MASRTTRGHLSRVPFLSALGLVAALLTSCASPAPPPPSVRVLFIGNSYTYVNDLPHLFATLAAAGKHPAEVEMVAPGGWTLMEHARSPDTRKKIDGSPWNFVVLQEQSIVPAVPQAREAGMYPAVRRLATIIRAHGSEPVLYATWGRRDGLGENGFADFQSMQTAITDGYLHIADELDVRVAPVGPAWQLAVAQHPGTPLWDGDGSHPALAGTYLAACVFYAALFHASPEGLPVPQGLDRSLGEQFQQYAATVVRGDASRWHLH